jgi:hypothetical protein
MISDIRELEDGFGLFFGEGFYLDAESLKKVIIFSAIFIYLRGRLDFFVQGRDVSFFSDNKRLFIVLGGNVDRL